MPCQRSQHRDRRTDHAQTSLQRRPDGERQRIPLRQLRVQELVRDSDAGERGAGDEEAEREDECEADLLPARDRHLDDVGEHEEDHPEVGHGVDECGGGHDGVVPVAGPDGEGSVAGEGVADDGGEGDEDGAVDADDADGREDEGPLERKLQDPEVEHQDAELGEEERELVHDDGAVREVDGNMLKAHGDILVLVAEAISSFNPDERDSDEREDPGDADQGVVPAPTSDQTA